MPKKFKGASSKSEAARERKDTAKREAEERRKQQEEDKLWIDDDKHVARKQDRKTDREKKRAEQLDKKVMARKLLEEEEEKLGGKSCASAGATRVTRAQIAETQVEARATAAATKSLPKGVSEPILLEENPNRIMQQRAAEGLFDAQTVEEAIAVLDVSSGEVAARHPERRVKAAYAVFEERELPRLKTKNPNLRMSQLKQLLRKEWMKSPENPMNQIGL